MREQEDIANYRFGGIPAQSPEQGNLWLAVATVGHKSDTRSGTQYAI